MWAARRATVVAITLFLGACLIAPTPEEELAAADRIVRDWVAAVVAGSEAERGYPLLHPEVRDEVSLDRYLEGIGGFQGATLEWSVLPGTDRDGSEVVGFFVVAVRVEGGSGALPADLIGLHLIQPLIDEYGRDAGIAVIVKSDDAGVGIWWPSR